MFSLFIIELWNRSNKRKIHWLEVHTYFEIESCDEGIVKDLDTSLLRLFFPLPLIFPRFVHHVFGEDMDTSCYRIFTEEKPILRHFS